MMTQVAFLYLHFDESHEIPSTKEARLETAGNDWVMKLLVCVLCA